MSIDGICLHALTYELNQKLSESHIKKIAQPEKEELILTASKERETFRLLISSLASLPVIYLTSENKTSPMTAPNFCMILRKYLNSGKITSVKQVGLERVLDFEIEHLNELGDPAKKHLYVEIMGKHSNIILCDEENTILDSIKHVNAFVSSVREVLPNRPYFVPAQKDHMDAFSVTKEDFYNILLKKPLPMKKMILSSLIGFGPVMAEELCYRANIDSDVSVLSLSDWQKDKLYEVFCNLINDMTNHSYTPTVILKNNKPFEVYPFALTHYKELENKTFSSMSEALEFFYATKNLKNNMEQRSYDLRKQIQTILDRNRKKLLIQEKQLKDTLSMDKYKLYGELLTANAYQISSGIKKVSLLNYYDNTNVEIPLDETLSAMENANKYYTKYNKLKRTKEALDTYMEETKKAISHLEMILSSLSTAESEEDLTQIRQELFEYGFTKKRPATKKGQHKKSAPLHFVTSDGYHIYVGKNNYQNEEVTFKIATGNDWWFHSKTIPGSHVIVKANNEELPDHIFELAASLAGYYSTGRDQDKIEIDYTQKKHLKKVAGAAPGYVIYHTNYSIIVSPEKRDVTLC